MLGDSIFTQYYNALHQSPTPTGDGYTFSGFPNIQGADYSAYNGTYSPTSQTLNGKNVYKNANDKCLYRYHWVYETEEETYEDYGWLVYDDTSLATGSDPQTIAFQALTQSANDSATPAAATSWYAGENLGMTYSDAYWEIHGEYPPSLNITCTSGGGS